MLKRKILLYLFFICIFCLIQISNTQAQDLIKLLIEKKINVDFKSGYILSSSIKNTDKINIRNTYSIDSIKPSQYTENRKYKILNNNNSFSSVISVISENGNEVKRISVGRGAVKLVLNPLSKNIFVLCTGYFGSVLEIDTKKDLVVRKYSTYYNPSDIFIDKSGKFFYVSSSKLQKFVIGSSNIIFDIDLPDEVKYIYSLASSGDNLISFSSFTSNKEIKSFTIDTETKKIINESSNIPFLESKEIQISNTIPSKIDNKDLAFVYSKNNDYIYIFSLYLSNIIGIIPLDYKIDDIVVMNNKALVLHRYINQISVIDLNNESPSKFSVIARIIDDRLNDPSNKMVVDENKIFIKSDNEQEGYIDENNILRYTMPILEVPFNKEKDIFVISKITNKRFFIKNSQLFYELLSDDNSIFSKKIKMDIFGNTISGLAIDDDGKYLYISDHGNNTIFIMDTLNNSIVNKITVGNKPGELIFHENYLFVLNTDDYIISVIDLKQNKIVNNIKIKIESASSNIVKIYDSDFKQIIKINFSPQFNKEISMVKLF